MVGRCFSDAVEKLKNAGIDEDRIETREIKCTLNVGKAIVDDIQKNNYSTVVVGRRGTGKAFFMGSVSKYVLSKTSDRALWLVS